MTVLGVDPSLTSSGLAFVGEQVRLTRIRTRKTRPGLNEKLDRIRYQLGAVVTASHGAELVMIEGLSLASIGTATRDLAGLWWLLINEIGRLGVPIGLVPPSCLKKWTTGNGNANKALMRQCIAVRWPKARPGSSDEADALALASMGLHHLGRLPWEPLPHQERSLDRVEWLLP